MKKLTTILFAVLISMAASAAKRPNVILIITDDQGYPEVGAHGNPSIHTPNLDALHSESLCFNDFHVDPTCAPTRGALMTGKYSHRARVWHTVRGGNHLRASEVTMADVFKYNGYKTAMFGKWHLGANYPYRPMDRGFEEWLGLGDGGPNTSDGYFWNDRVNDMYWHNGEREYREGYNPDVFFGAAEDYIKNYTSDKPFFLYLATYTPHKPYTFPRPDFHKKYMDMGMDKELASYYAIIEHVDGLVGDLRTVLKEEKRSDNTILIFMTDNGSTHARSENVYSAGLAGGKGSTSEGGHRVPFFFHWPDGKLGKPRTISTLTAHIDVLPTLTELCNMTLPKQIDFDGKSIVPLLKGETDNWPERTLVVEKQRNVNNTPTNSAIMTQKWRLTGHKKLYNIQEDLGQTKDVSGQYPEVVEKLLTDFDKHWKRVTPDDRSFPCPIVGTDFDKETFLSISELRDGSGYSHGYCAEGSEAKGVWHIETAQEGTYRFEVRRWPKEAAAPFNGVPEVNKTVDAWSSRGPKQTFLTRGNITALPISSVSIKVGDFYQKVDVKSNDEQLSFDVKLSKGKWIVDAAFYDKDDNKITNAYYVYVRKK